MSPQAMLYLVNDWLERFQRACFLTSIVTMRRSSKRNTDKIEKRKGWYQPRMPHRSSNGVDMVIPVEQVSNLCWLLGCGSDINLRSTMERLERRLDNGRSERRKANAAAERTKAGFAAKSKAFPAANLLVAGRLWDRWTRDIQMTNLKEKYLATEERLSPVRCNFSRESVTRARHRRMQEEHDETAKKRKYRAETANVFPSYRPRSDIIKILSCLLGFYY